MPKKRAKVKYQWAISFTLLLLLFIIQQALAIQKCSSYIYCYGKILHTVQMSGIFNDSKTFVDMPSIKPEKEVT